MMTGGGCGCERGIYDIALTSSIASLISRCLLHPLDTIKSKIQVSIRHNNNTPTTINTPHDRTIMKNVLLYTRSSSSLGGGGGVVKELYKGIGVAAIGGIPAGALYFTCYHIIRNQCINIRQSMSSSPPSIHGDAVIDLTAGFIAEGISCMIWVPIDVCKEQLQTQKELGITNFKGSIDALRGNSLSRLYKGYWATLASFGPFSALYFAFAQKYKSWIASSSYYHSCGHDRLNTNEHHDATVNMMMLPFHAHVLSCAAAGASAAFITTPLDLVKLRLQVQRSSGISSSSYHHRRRPRPPDSIIAPSATTTTTASASSSSSSASSSLSSSSSFHYTSFINGLMTLYRTEGVKGMFRGSLMRILFFAPNTALTMSIMEYLLQLKQQG